VKLSRARASNLRHVAVGAIQSLVSAKYDATTLVSGHHLTLADVDRYCHDAESEDIQAMGSTILLRLCEHCLANLPRLEVLERVVQLLERSHEPSVRRNARLCVNHLVLHDDTRQRLMEPGNQVLRRMADELLEAPENVRTFAELAAMEAAECAIVVQLGVLAKLAAVMRLHPSEALENEVAWMVSNVLVDTPESIRAAADAGLVAPFVRLLLEERPNRVHINAAYVIKHALASLKPHEIEHANRLVPIGQCILGRLRATDLDNTKLLSPLLSALASLLAPDASFRAALVTPELAHLSADYIRSQLLPAKIKDPSIAKSCEKLIALQSSLVKIDDNTAPRFVL